MIWLVFVVLFVLAVWGNYLIDKTYKQRVAIAIAINKTESALYDCFDVVSFDAHFWALLTRRDPMLLYPKNIQELMK